MIKFKYVYIFLLLFWINSYSQEWIYFNNAKPNSTYGMANGKLAKNSTSYVSKKGGILFRVDDNQTIEDYNEYENVFKKYNKKFNFAVNLGLIEFKEQNYVDGIKTLQNNGNELMDHTPEHRTNFFTTIFNTTDYVNLKGVDHLVGNKVCLKHAPVDTSKAERSGTVSVNGDKVTGSNGEFDDFDQGEDVYIYFPSLSKLVFIKEFVNSKKVKISDFWEEDIDLGNHSNIKYFKFNVYTIHMALDAIEVLGNESLKLANHYGIQRPYTWIEPGGTFPQLYSDEVAEALGNRLGYKAAAVYPNSAKKVYDEYDPNNDRKYAMQWGDFLDDEKTVKENKTTIAQGIAKNYMLIGHSHFTNAMGGFHAYVNRVDSLLDWATANNIPVIKYTQMADSLYNYLPDPYENAFPLLNSDIDQNGIPDGYTNIEYPEQLYGTWVIDTTTPGPGANYYKITTGEPWANKITHIIKLGGLEKGENEFSIWTQGEPGDSISVQFSEPWPSTVTYGFKFPANTAYWKKYTIDDARPLGSQKTLSFLESQSTMDVDFYCTDYVGGTVKICGMYLAKKDSVAPVYNTTFDEKLIVLDNSNSSLKIAVQVKGNDLPPGKTLASSTIDVTYDKTILSFVSAENWRYGNNEGYINKAENKDGYVHIQSDGTTVNKNGNGNPAGYDIQANYDNWVELNFTKIVNNQDIVLNISSSTNILSLFKNENNEPKTDEKVNYDNTKINRYGVIINPTTSNGPDGTLDDTFGNGGIATISFGTNDYCYDAVITNEGKILTVGYTNVNGHNNFAIARFNTNGTPDNSFGNNGKTTTAIGTVNDEAYSVTLSSKGKIVVAGYSNMSGTKRFALVRYNSNGTLDNTFGSNGIVTTAIGSDDDIATSIVKDKNNNIVVAGFSKSGNLYKVAVAKYDTNGVLVNTFGNNGTTILNEGVNNITNKDVYPDVSIDNFERIVIRAGTDLLIRLDSSGNLDNSFGTGGIVHTTNGYSNSASVDMAIDLDGRIVLVGNGEDNSQDFGFYLSRYAADGNSDNDFGINGVSDVAWGYKFYLGKDATIDAQGRILTACIYSEDSTETYHKDFGIFRDVDGGWGDDSFDEDGIVETVISGTDEVAEYIGIDPNGKIVLAGTQLSENGSDFVVARYYGSTKSGQLGSNVGKHNYLMNQNYPNPFNPTTVIRFKIPNDNNVTLKVYNMIGEEVATLVDDYKSAGLYKVTFNADNLPSGVYIYRLQAGRFTEIHKMILLK